MKHHSSSQQQSGFLMIEVLVTLVILVFGLLGLVSLQARGYQAESESYQRVQALVLLRDIANRINANRASALSYVTGTSSPLGYGSSKDCSAPANAVDVDLCAWQAALLGAAETIGSCDTSSGNTSSVNNCRGAMIRARGCITSPATDQYLVQVVWQGLSQSTNPPNSVACGKDSYGSESASGTSGLRRAVTTVVQIGNLN